jgi:hypothetical protein
MKNQCGALVFLLEQSLQIYLHKVVEIEKADPLK